MEIILGLFFIFVCLVCLWLANHDWEASSKCNCGDSTCTRKVIASEGGRLSVEDHFGCPKVQQQIEKLKDKKL